MINNHNSSQISGNKCNNLFVYIISDVYTVRRVYSIDTSHVTKQYKQRLSKGHERVTAKGVIILIF